MLKPSQHNYVEGLSFFYRLLCNKDCWGWKPVSVIEFLAFFCDNEILDCLTVAISIFLIIGWICS
jgi:hypothetical protein